MTIDIPIDLDVEGLLAFIYSIEEDKEHRKSVLVTMQYLEECISNEANKEAGIASILNFSYIDELFEKLDLTKVGPHCMIGSIRCTFRIKNHIKNWYSLLERIKAEMIRRNMDYKASLIGLI